MEQWDLPRFLVWHLSVFWLLLCLSGIVFLIVRQINMESTLRHHRALGDLGPFSLSRVQLGLAALVIMFIPALDFPRAEDVRTLATFAAVSLLVGTGGILIVARGRASRKRVAPWLQP